MVELQDQILIQNEKVIYLKFKYCKNYYDSFEISVFKDLIDHFNLNEKTISFLEEEYKLLFETNKK